MSGATIGGSAFAADELKEAERWVVIAWLESFRAPLSLSFRAADLRHLESGPRDVRAEGRSATIGPMRDEEIIRRVEAFRFHAGAMTAERRNRGFTLIHVATGIPIARLRKVAGEEAQFDILYWSLCKERWVPFGPFGRTVTTLAQALRIIAEASIFWVFYESQV